MGGNRFWRWVKKPAYPWEFWLPQSGIVGGILIGFVIFCLVSSCHRLFP